MSNVKLKPDTEWVFSVGNETFGGALHARPKFELVRCKECVHCSENGGEGCPVEEHKPIQMDGFCHFGERKMK